MIKAINFPNQYLFNKKQNAKEATPNKVSSNKNFELSDYKTGQAILARNAVSFKNLSKLNNTSTDNIDEFKPNKTKTVIYRPFDKDIAMKTYYPYKADSLRDNIVALYTSCLLFLYRPPYITTDATAGRISQFEDLKDVNNKYKFCVSLPLAVIDNSKYNCKDTRSIYDGMIYTFLDEKLLGNTLESLKETRKKHLKDIYSRDDKDEYKQNYIHKYGKDISKIYEVIDSIILNDIEEFVKNYLINQEPITVINSNVYDNEDIQGKYDGN